MFLSGDAGGADEEDLNLIPVLIPSAAQRISREIIFNVLFTGVCKWILHSFRTNNILLYWRCCATLLIKMKEVNVYIFLTISKARPTDKKRIQFVSLLMWAVIK